MNVHRNINNRELLEYIHTPSTGINAKGELCFMKHYKHEFEHPLILVNLVFQGVEALHKTVHSDKHYCHDCSTDHRHAVYHFTDNSFDEFLAKWCRYGKQLNEVKSELGIY